MASSTKSNAKSRSQSSKPSRNGDSAPLLNKDLPSTVDHLDLFKMMYLIRQFEIACGENYSKGLIRGFLHLYIGQEATGVGAVSSLREDDYIVSHYRDHGHALARGEAARARVRPRAAAARAAWKHSTKKNVGHYFRG